MLTKVEVAIEGNPDYGRATVHLDPGERVLTESGAMAWMDPGVDLRARLGGGLGRALLRRFLGRESLLLGEYSAERGGRLGLSPTVPGTVVRRQLDGADLWPPGTSRPSATG
ncbi:MAG: AIM24 family protein, partial [Planctomycetota bacterium]